MRVAPNTGPRSCEIAGSHEGEEVAHVDRAELARPGSRGRGAGARAARAAPSPPIASSPPPLVSSTSRSTQRVALEHRAARPPTRTARRARAAYMLPFRIAIAPASRGCSQVPSTCTSAARRPADAADGRRDGLEHAEVHAVGVGAGPRAGRRSARCSHSRQRRGPAGGGPRPARDVLARAPEVEVGVEPPVGVVEHALHEGRLEVAEAAVGQPRGPAERRRRARCPPICMSSPSLAVHAGRIALEQAVEVAAGRVRAPRATSRRASSAADCPATRTRPEPSSACEREAGSVGGAESASATITGARARYRRAAQRGLQGVEPDLVRRCRATRQLPGGVDPAGVTRGRCRRPSPASRRSPATGGRCG